MIRTHAEAICWMSSHDKALLVVTADNARLVDSRYHAESLSRGAAKSLTGVRRHLFEITYRGDKTVLNLGEQGERYHERLIERGLCACPKAKGGRV